MVIIDFKFTHTIHILNLIFRIIEIVKRLEML